MATPKEKQETIDVLKGPRHYRFALWGYGSEATYINLTKEAYDFWKPICEEHGDTDLVEYVINAEDDHYDFEYIEDIPAKAKFMTEGDYTYPWFEPPNEFSHQHGVSIDNTSLTVEEVDSEEYNSQILNEVIDRVDLLDYLNEVMESEDWNIELTKPDENEEDHGGKYVLQFYSSEKGTFFDGIISTHGEFDPKKLVVTYTEFPNGDDIVTYIEYDGEEIENYGGDTNGKGYSAAVWEN